MPGKPAARVEVHGAKELRAAMKAANQDLRDWTKAHRAAAKPVLERAREIVPVLTGSLRGSIRISAGKESARVLAGSDAVPYAGPIHFGWAARNIAPNPFLYDAADDRADAVYDTYNKQVEGIVRKIDRMTPG